MTDKSEFDNEQDYGKKRQLLLEEMVGDILEQGMEKEEIAARTVSMIILCKGNINRYQEAIELMFDVIERVSVERAKEEWEADRDLQDKEDALRSVDDVD